MMEPSGTTFVAHAAWMGASQARGGRVSNVRRREHGTGAGPHMMNPTSRREDPLLRRSADAMSAQQTARASVHMAAVAAALANARRMALHFFRGWRKKAQKARMLALLALLILTSGVAAFTPPTPAPVLRCCACAAVHQRRPCRIESPFSHVPRTRQDRGQDRVLGTCRDAQPTVVSRSPACLRGLTCEPPARGRASTHRRRRAPCSEGRKGGHDLRTEPEAVDDRGRAHSARIRRYSHGRHMRSVCLTISV